MGCAASNTIQPLSLGDSSEVEDKDTSHLLANDGNRYGVENLLPSIYDTEIIEVLFHVVCLVIFLSHLPISIDRSLVFCKCISSFFTTLEVLKLNLFNI